MVVFKLRNARFLLGRSRPDLVDVRNVGTVLTKMVGALNAATRCRGGRGGRENSTSHEVVTYLGLHVRSLPYFSVATNLKEQDFATAPHGRRRVLLAATQYGPAANPASLNPSALVVPLLPEPIAPRVLCIWHPRLKVREGGRPLGQPPVNGWTGTQLASTAPISFSLDAVLRVWPPSRPRQANPPPPVRPVTATPTSLVSLHLYRLNEPAKAMRR